jgi:hypothetical protein
MMGVMDRAEQIIDDLTEHVPPDCEPLQVVDDTWSDLYPGGFAPVTKVSEGDIFRFDPARIVATTSHLDDDDFAIYLVAITTWWWFSYQPFTMLFDGAEILGMFIAGEPELAMHIMLVADHNESTLIEWVGITGREQ